MFHVLQTEVFSKWLSQLRDARAKARIVARVDAVRRGHFGDKATQDKDIVRARKMATELG